MLKKPIPSTGGRNVAKSERRFCARVPGRTSRRHFRMLRCSLLCNVPSADPDIQNRASTIEIALQHSTPKFNVLKSNFNVQKRNFNVRKTNSNVRNSNFRVRKVNFRVRKTNFNVRKSNFRVRKSIFRVRKSNFRVLKTNFRMLEANLTLLKANFKVLKLEKNKILIVQFVSQVIHQF